MIGLAAFAASAVPVLAHGGAVGASASASPNGPLQAVVRLSATWLNDGDDAAGLSVSASASGPGSAGPVPLAETSDGKYQGTMNFPAGGTWQVTVSWSGNGSTPGSIGTSVTVESAAPPVTQPPATAPPTPPPATGGGSGGSTGSSVTTAPPAVGPADPSPPNAPTTAALSVVPVVLVPNRAPRGGYATIDFAVPNANSSLAVHTVTIELPERTLSVTPRAMTGWTASLETSALPTNGNATNVTEQVNTVTWSASGPGVAPGEFERFTIILGPLPKKGKTVAFPVTQMYTDGSTATWEPTTGAATTTAERVAPTLRLTKTTKRSANPGAH